MTLTDWVIAYAVLCVFAGPVISMAFFIGCAVGRNETWSRGYSAGREIGFLEGRTSERRETKEA